MISLPSLLDNDFYKFTMQQGVNKIFPKAKARYEFINRGKHAFPEDFDVALRQSIDAMASLKLTGAEKKWLAATCSYLDPVYLDFLQGYCYNPDEVTIQQDGANLRVSIEGYWYRTILWEVPILCLISENYYALNPEQRDSDEKIIETTRDKIETYKGSELTIAEFGTRRRHSYHVHSIVVETLKQYGKTFAGTSNMHFAMKYDTKPIGTHAHEWFMFHAAQYGFKMANTVALEHWVDVYRGDLGIALSDTYTTEEFFDIFDKKFAKLFDGVRHDSGDPIEFAQKSIQHYQRLGINPLTKTIIFSDALHKEKVQRISDFCRGKIGMSFGIGTDFTNDTGVKAMNIVLKMTEAQPEGQPWTPVIKLSDEPGKHSGDKRMIELAKTVLQINTLSTNI